MISVHVEKQCSSPLTIWLVVNLVSVAKKSLLFQLFFFAKLQFSDSVHKAHHLPNLHHF